MRIPVLILSLVLAIGGLLAGAALSGEAPVQAVVHPEHPSLLRAADGFSRSAGVWWIGVAFAGLQVAFFGACFALGMQRRGALGPVRRPLALGLLVYAGVYALMLGVYRAWALDPGGALRLGFPAPTALMLYGLWPAPLVFLWIYLRHFDGWVLRPEDLERVRRLAREAEPQREP